MSAPRASLDPTPEELRERAVRLLDMQLDLLLDLLGPNAMQALVAGRVLRAQMKRGWAGADT